MQCSVVLKLLHKSSKSKKTNPVALEEHSLMHCCLTAVLISKENCRSESVWGFVFFFLNSWLNTFTAANCVCACPYLCVHSMTEKRASREMLAFHAGSYLWILHMSKCIHQDRVYYASLFHMHFSRTEQREC